MLAAGAAGLALGAAVALPAAATPRTAGQVAVVARAAPSPSPGEASVELGVIIGPHPSATPTSPTPGSPTPTLPRPTTSSPNPGGGGDDDGDDKPTLPRTGMAITMIVLAGVALIGGGVLLRILARRRAEAERWMAR